MASVLASVVLPVSSSAAPVASTPYMGWNPYYAGLTGADESTLESVANSLISSGLQQAGYRIFWLDWGWASGERDSDGNLIISPTQWPDGMLGFTKWLHAHGFLAGIYTDAGTSGCRNLGVGSYGHYGAGSTNPYSQDINQFAAWGFDAVKADFCGAGQEWGFQPPYDPRTLYQQFSSAVANNSSARPMILNICDFWSPGAVGGGLPLIADSSWDTYSWAPVLGQSWRTDTDIGFPGNVVFANVLRNLDQDSTSQTALQATPTIQDAVGPPGSSGLASGHWNDPDYLAPELGMTDTEAQSQFSMWAMVAAPLMLGSDPRTLSSTTISMLENPQVIAIDQDQLGRQGSLLSQSGNGQVWVKPLANGDRAVALFNRGSNAMQISTTANAAGLPQTGAYRLLNTWSNETTMSTGEISANVPSDAVVLYRIKAVPAPAVAISSPANGAVFVRGQKVRTTFRCSSAADRTPIDSCRDSNGAASPHGTLDTSTAGSHSYRVTATAMDGAQKTSRITYKVVKLSIRSGQARYAAGKTRIKLACAGPTGATCRGSLTLTERRRVMVMRLMRGRERKLQAYETIVLGRTHYYLRARRSALVSLRLRRASGTVRAQATATMRGRAVTTRAITLRSNLPQRAPGRSTRARA